MASGPVCKLRRRKADTGTHSTAHLTEIASRHHPFPHMTLELAPSRADGDLPPHSDRRHSPVVQRCRARLAQLQCEPDCTAGLPFAGRRPSRHRPPGSRASGRSPGHSVAIRGCRTGRAGLWFLAIRPTRAAALRTSMGCRNGFRPGRPRPGSDLASATRCNICRHTRNRPRNCRIFRRSRSVSSLPRRSGSAPGQTLSTAAFRTSARLPEPEPGSCRSSAP